MILDQIHKACQNRGTEPALVSEIKMNNNILYLLLNEMDY